MQAILPLGSAEPAGADPCGAEPRGADPRGADPRGAEPRGAEPRGAGPEWVDTLRSFLLPYWNHLLDGEWATGVAQSRMSLEEMRGWILQIYPFIHAFPKFLAEALIKADDEYTRNFLIDNIRVEKAHAEHWIWMGVGFGLTREEMLEVAEGERPALRDVQSLSDWLWYINAKGSLAEAVAATSFAIEGITGELARKVVAGFESYGRMPGVAMGPKTYKWMREHARYDEEHPRIALEIVTLYATDDRTRTKVMLAAKRSLQLLDLALVTAYRAYAPPRNVIPLVESEQRANDRRKRQLDTSFPERRFRDRRGLGHTAKMIG
jgi:pyrroloquinoline quinone (PQQ) biosynthesis protein C